MEVTYFWSPWMTGSYHPRLQLQGVDAVAANSDASASDTKDLLERLGCTTGAPLRWVGVLSMAEYLSGTWA